MNTRNGSKVARLVCVMAAGLLLFSVGAQGYIVTFQQGVDGYTGHGGRSDCGDNYFIGSSGGDPQGRERNYGYSEEIRLSGSVNPNYNSEWVAVAAQSVWKNIIGTGEGMIPSGATINSAKLRLYAHLTASEGYVEDVGMSVYSWSAQQYPGTYNDERPLVAQSYPDDPSVWASVRTHRIFYSTAWAAGYVPQPGDDTTSATPWDTVTVPDAEHDAWQPHWIEFDVTDAVQEWADGTTENYGFALFTDTIKAGFHFRSSEFGSTEAEIALRPMLEVDIADGQQGGAVYTFQQGVDGYYGNGNASDRGDTFLVTSQDGNNSYQRNYGVAENLQVGGSENTDLVHRWAIPCMVSVWKDYVGNGLRQVPAGSQIQSATLRLYAYEMFSTDENVDIGLEVYSPAKQVWPGLYNATIPLNAGANPSAPGSWASTGGYRQFYSSGWDGGAWWLPKKGTDTSQATPWSTTVISDAVADNWTGGWVELDVTAPVQAVIDGTDTDNFGFMMFTDTVWAGLRFHSAEAVDASLRPQLVITLPPSTCDGVKQTGYYDALTADLNGDCYVEWADFGIFAGQWQNCLDPQDANCSHPWE